MQGLLRVLVGRVFLPHRVLTGAVHTSSRVLVKSFVDGENSYAHNILRKVGKYSLMPAVDSSVLFTSNPDVEFSAELGQADNVKLVETLEQIAVYCKQHGLTIAEERWDGVVDLFVERVDSFSDDQLMSTLRILTMFPPTHGVATRNFLEMWKALEEECMNRLDSWSTDQRLLACDHWFKLNMAKVCNFPFVATKRMGRNLKRLRPDQLVQTLFYVNMQRKVVLDMFPFEEALKRVLDQLTVEEISVMAMGFFKTQTRLNIPEVVDGIYKRLDEECLTLADIPLTALLKILRYSAKLSHADRVIHIQKKLLPRISDDMSLLSCLHLALLGTGFQCGDMDCISAVIKRYLRDYKVARLKDCERIAFVMALFNVQTKDAQDLGKAILEEIPKRKEEIIKYKRCYPALLNYLAICGHYNEEMIHVALSKKFYEAAYGQNLLLGRDIFCLDSFTRINLAGTYKGETLSERQRRNYAKLLCNYIPEKDSKYKISVSDKCLLETKAALDEIYGSQCTILENVLPHYDRADILMAFDEVTKKPIEITSLNLPEHYSGIILSREKLLKSIDNPENIQIVSVVFGGFNSYTRGNQEITGPLRMKLDQLRKIGHLAVEVPFYEWQHKTDRERTVYLTHRITKALASSPRTFVP